MRRSESSPPPRRRARAGLARRGRRRDLDDRPRHRRHGDRPALSQPHAEQQRRRAPLRLSWSQRNEKSQLEPGARDRVEDDRSADLGVQAAQGRQVPRRQRLHGGGRRRVDRARADGAEQPVAVHRVHEADQGDRSSSIRTRSASGRRTPYPLMPSDMTQIAIISKAAAKATTDDFNTGKAAIGTGPYKLVRYAKGDRIELARNDAWWGGKTPWEKVTLRLAAAGRVARRGAAVGRRAGDRERADGRRREAAQDKRLALYRHRRRPAHLPAHRQRPRRVAVRDRQGRQAAREESAQGSARAEGDVEGDQPPGDRRAR